MNTAELNTHGWQFDHLHFEILKVMPKPLEPGAERPHCFFGTYCLECYDRKDLLERYYDPEAFLKERWRH